MVVVAMCVAGALMYLWQRNLDAPYQSPPSRHQQDHVAQDLPSLVGRAGGHQPVAEPLESSLATAVPAQEQQLWIVRCLDIATLHPVAGLHLVVTGTWEGKATTLLAVSDEAGEATF